MIRFLDRGTQLLRPPLKIQTTVAQSLAFSVFLKLACSQMVKTAGTNAQLPARPVVCTELHYQRKTWPSVYERILKHDGSV